MQEWWAEVKHKRNHEPGCAGTGLICGGLSLLPTRLQEFTTNVSEPQDRLISLVNSGGQSCFGNTWRTSSIYGRGGYKVLAYQWTLTMPQCRSRPYTAPDINTACLLATRFSSGIHHPYYVNASSHSVCVCLIFQSQSTWQSVSSPLLLGSCYHLLLRWPVMQTSSANLILLNLSKNNRWSRTNTHNWNF